MKKSDYQHEINEIMACFQRLNVPMTRGVIRSSASLRRLQHTQAALNYLVSIGKLRRIDRGLLSPQYQLMRSD